MSGARSLWETAAGRCASMLVALFAVASFSASARAAIPAGPGVPTMAQYREKALTFEARLTVDVYRQAGVKSPKWDDRAVAFLNAYNRFILGFDDAPAVSDLVRQARMITVCMGEGQQAEARLWFDRAVAARFDYEPAYVSYLSLLMPRWGGSPQKLLAFGTECAATGRFDTNVPFFLYRSQQYIRRDSDGSFEPWAQFHAYAALEDAALKTAAAPEHRSRAAYCRTIAAAVAVRQNQYEEALKLIKELHGQLDMTAADEMGFRVEDLRGKVYAMTGASAKAVINAEICRERGAAPEAARFYEESLEPYLVHAAKPPAATTRPADPFALVEIDTNKDVAQSPAATPEVEAARYLRSLAVAMRWQTDFNSGKEVALTSRGDLAGWWLDYGRATADSNGDLIGRSDGSVLRIHCLADFGREWEMSLEVAFLRSGERTDAGVLMFPRDVSLYHSVRFYRNGEVIAETCINVEKPEPAAIKAVNHVTITSHAGKVTVRLNGRLVLNDKAIDGYDVNGEIRVGLCSFELGADDVVRFGDVRIKRLLIP
jgi:hypothetical protein